MNALHNLIVKCKAVGLFLVSPGSAFSFYSVATAFALGFMFLVWRRKSRRGGADLAVVARAVFSLRLLKSRSTKADLFYFFVSTLALGGLIGWGMMSGEVVSAWVAQSLDAAFGARPAAAVAAWNWRVGATVSLFLAYEFGYWLDHFLKHKVPALWELHKTHHTAEVLTPLTAFRVHPLDTMIFSNVLAVCVGVTTGVLNHVAGAKVAEICVSGTNVFLVFFIFTTVQLQHSQFWIAFQGVWARLLLSPAHHQIHHSVDPGHYNANLGSTLAIFDWAFGTLLPPARENPRLRFGVIDDARDPHAIQELMLTPVLQFFLRLWEATGLRRPSTPLAAGPEPT